jgi:signal transduction histidine kinase
MEDSSLHFKVHPSVVYQLGESLISDAMQAIIELVKNSYDADASYSKVIIDTQGITKPEDSFFKDEEGGVITVEDDGCGMNLGDLKNGWLTISNRQKQQVKKERKTTDKGRTPLGDKGLGRLGVQKLGKNLEIYTKKNDKDKQAYHIGFSWLDFTISEKLENVSVQLQKTSYQKANGTKIVISGLMEPGLWKIEKENQERKGKKKNNQETIIEKLKKELSRLISPYKEIRDFTVYIEIDNKGIDLIEISDSVRNNALLRYKFDFNGKKLIVSGKAKLDYFLPTKRDDLSLFQKIVKGDNGNQFYRYLENQNFARQYNLKKSKNKVWYIDFLYHRTFSEIDKVEYIESKKIASPGPFFGEIDSFNLNFYDDDEQHIFDKKSEYKQVIKGISGIRVYRDGFAIRVDQDWLGLGTQQTSGGSFYGLRPMNTLGFVSLTARDNMDLEETTDREGFKDTSYYRNFFLLMQEFIKFAGNIQEDLRRAWLEFKKLYKESEAHIDSQVTIADITQTLKRKLGNAPDYKSNINVFKERILRNKSASDKTLEELKAADEISPALRKKAVDVLEQFKPLLDETNNTLDRLGDYLKELEALGSLPGIINDRVNNLRHQMEMVYESIALGLTAEALSHEINNIMDQLSRRAKAIKVDLDKRNITDRNILIFIEYVKTAVIGLQKQMSFLSPTLRYVRENRQEIVLNNFINELIEYYKERMGNYAIVIKFLDMDSMPFKIKINKGKLIQIIDNLVLNSEYWLKEDIKHEKIKKGIIEIKMESPFIQIYDYGRGIDPSVESILFQPFISTKHNGRGLGLFIVKQLLDSEGCSIELLPDRNKRNHLYKFQIDLRGVIDE